MKRINIYLISFILYSLLISGVFYPIFFNKLLFPNDFGMTYFQPFSNNYSKVVSYNHYINDVFLQFVPYRYTMQKSFREFNFDFWNPNKCGGIPQYCITYATNFEITNFVYLLFPFKFAWHLQILLQCIISAMAMFSFLLYLKINNKIAFLCGFAFSLNSMFISYLSYFYIAGAFCWVPFLLLSYEKYIDSGELKYFFASSLFLGLSMLGGFIQSIFFVIVLFILYAVTKKNETEISILRKFKLIFSIFILSLLLTAFMWIPTIEYFIQDFAKGYSRFEGNVYHFTFYKRLIMSFLTLSFAFPEIMGDFRGFDIRRILDSFPNDFHAYIGLPLLILFVYAIIKHKKYNIRHWLIIAAVSLVLPLFTPLYKFLYDRFFILYITAAIVVGGIVLNDFINRESNNKDDKLFKLSRSVLIVFCIVLFVFVIVNIFFYFYEKNIIDFLRSKMYGSINQRNLYNENWFNERIFLTLNGYKLNNLFVLGGLFLNLFIIIIFIRYSKGNLKFSHFFWFIALVTFIQLFRFVHFWTPFVDTTKYPFYPENELVQYLQKNSKFERIEVIRNDKIKNFLPGNIEDIYMLQFIDGYEGILPQTFYNYFQPTDKKNLSDPRLLGLFNVKYLVADSSFIFKNNFVEKFYSYQNYIVYKNNLVRNRVELFNKVKFVPLRDMDNFILNNNFTGDTLLLEKSTPRLYHNNSNSGYANIKSYRNNSVKINYYSKYSAYLKLADVYYPGWTATIDGVETQIYKANDCMRAIIVPPGNHNVEFIFKPFVFKLGMIISFITLFSIVISIIFIKNY
ncbi:MAG: YfhO family protein [Ignavibacteriae bacterium]|nr:YfhO family protein [Ignavibacteriota bacterium]